MVTIKSLEANDLHDFLDFFDHRAFSNDPDWEGCYCQGFMAVQPAWDGKSDPKPILRQASCDNLSAGKMQGYLAYKNGKVIAWCAAGESKLFSFPDAQEKLARVVCFVVQEELRGQGIANQLLEFALEDLKAKGFSEVEARPVRPEDKSKMNFRGSHSMYLKHGFTEFRDLGEDGIVVRREL